MLTSNIKFINFNISKYRKLKKFKNEKWFKKIKLGCTKNIQPENIVPVDTTANTQPGKYLPNIKNSVGVITFL